MKYLVASFLLFFCTLQTFGQREYFIYLQTDNSQPFYARLNNAVYSSTNSGYLILAKLPDSAVSVTIGFPKNVYPEQQFNIPATHKDGGYLIKNFADKGWGLFNLQTLSVIMSTAPDEKKKPEITGSRKNDAFSLLLANAVNDTAVLYAVNKPKPAPVALVSEKKKDTLRADAPAAKDTAIIAAKLSPAPDSSQLAASRKKDSVVKPLPPVPDSNKAIAKEKLPAPDTAQAMANKPLPVKRTATAPAKDTVAVAVVTKTRRPLFSLPGRKEQAPRKDTIIMMNNKGNVSNPPPPNRTPSRDSLVASNTAKKAKPSADSGITLRKQSPKADSTRSAVVNKATVTPVVPDNGKEQLKKQDSALAVINSPVRPAITKAADFFTDSGYSSVFIDASEKGSDTIRLSIPFAPKATASPNNEPRQETAASSRKDSTPAAATDTGVNAAASTAKTGNNAAALPNSDCKEIAWDSDIDKLRIKMLLVNTDDEKITVAKKVYRQKCFSVKQVKALTELFKEDEGRYKWFDAVYPYVSDSGHFASLAELLKTDYYLNRFKAMLRN